MPVIVSRVIKFLFAVLVMSVSPLDADAKSEGGWKAGVAAADITPKESIWLAGYALRDRPSEGVLQNIHVKALALQDSGGDVSVLVTSDLVGITRSMAEEVARQAREKFGVSRDRLILSASHTHSAPVTGDALHLFYDLDARQKALTNQYTRRVLGQMIEVIGASIERLSPVKLAFDYGLAGFAVNRRRAAAGKRHLPGPVDHDVPVLSVRDERGNLRAVAFGYACHATALSGYQINGDYPGFAQEEIEKAHPGATALFVAGCGADANPLPRVRGEITKNAIDLAANYGRILGNAVDLVLRGEMRPLDGPLKTAWREINLPLQPAPTRQQLNAKVQRAGEAFERRQYDFLIRKLDRDGRLPDHYAYPLQVWQFGRGLTLIAMAGEPVSDYSLRFKAQYGWDDVWVAGYCNDLPGYIPSLRVLREGGYEGGEGMPGVGLPAPFSAEIEDLISGEVDHLIKRTTVRE